MHAAEQLQTLRFSTEIKEIIEGAMDIQNPQMEELKERHIHRLSKLSDIYSYYTLV